jgi:orotidine-5'-phosphate decarboxylase
LIFAALRTFMHYHRVQSSIAAKDKIIVPLDVPTGDASRRLVRQLGGRIGFFKVGSQLFTADGPDIVEEIRDSGSKVFLDLKFHDIPTTVHHAVEAACGLGVDMLTVHLSGGRTMCEAAAKAGGGRTTLVLGVTILTSLSDGDLGELGFREPVRDQVILLAGLAQQTGITGLVASPQELSLLRECFGSFFTIVVPGIRPDWSKADDQKRTMTPYEALRAGADYLVIGRPITAAADPLEAAQRIIDEVARRSERPA